ncbi:MAG TPA: glycosyltransferase, partial [Kineosporiaceae bacterium]|nr:glycosyltransferase [Kineosporiaceae bacterium]
MAPHAVIVIDPSVPGAPDLADAAPAAVRDDPVRVIERTDAEVVVVVAGDVSLPAGWLAPVLEPFTDPWVAAVGPMLSSGPPAQDAAGADDDATPGTDGGHAALRLDARCWAVRVAAARSAGGLRALPALAGIEVDDLCRRLTAAGHTICVVEGVCADVGGAAPLERAEAITREIGHLARVASAARVGPLLSAALIVKDEEENLPACLASLSGLVDEVVVYDTGSTDRTVEIAR